MSYFFKFDVAYHTCFAGQFRCNINFVRENTCRQRCRIFVMSTSRIICVLRDKVDATSILYGKTRIGSDSPPPLGPSDLHLNQLSATLSNHRVLRGRLLPRALCREGREGTYTYLPYLPSLKIAFSDFSATTASSLNNQRSATPAQDRLTAD